MCLLCWKTFIKSVRKQYILHRERHYPQFIFSVSLAKNISAKLHFFGLYSSFSFSYFLAYFKKYCQLRVQNVDKPSCVFL